MTSCQSQDMAAQFKKLQKDQPLNNIIYQGNSNIFSSLKKD